MKTLSLLLAFVTTLFSCKEHQISSIRPTEILRESVSPTFAKGIAPENQTVLSVIQKDSSGASVMLLYFSNDDTTATDSVLIPSTQGVDINPENMPKLAFGSSTAILLWGEKAPHRLSSYAGRIFYAVSKDGGKTWSQKSPLVTDTTSYDQRYFDIETDSDGNFFCTWLDNRESSELEGSALYFGRLGVNGIETEQRISESVCPCCRTDLYIHEDSMMYIAFRKIFNDSIRDMACISSMDAGKSFTEARRISEDNWVLNGCPHTGPSIAVKDSFVYFAWYTLGGGDGVFQCRAPLNLSYFGFRENLSNKVMAKHPQSISTEEGILSVWDEPKPGSDQNRIGFRITGSDETYSEWSMDYPGNYPVLYSNDNQIRMACTIQNKGKETVKVFLVQPQPANSRLY